MAIALDDPRHRLKDPSLLRDACYIDGAWVAADSGKRFAVTNPVDGKVLAEVPMCGAAETRHAIEAADRALVGWRQETAKERARLLRRWFDLLTENADDLAMLMTLEQGKPLAEAKGEVAYGAAFVEWFAEEAKRVYGDTIPSPFSSRRILVMRQPIGVCGMITPWNFPLAMITRKAAPALAVGCTVVIKPAGLTPLTALAAVELAARAGFPKGVVNMVTGSSSAIGGELTSNRTVRKISFTGSTEVGKILLEQCASTVKKVSLELGGHAPFIVFDDADLDAAVEGAIASKFRNAGQTCVCMNRLYVQAGVHDAFAEKFAAKVAALKVGNGLETGVQIGPLIDTDAVKKAQAHVEDALAKGARLVTGGKPHAAGDQFFQPTVLAGCTPDMVIAHEETFGPVAPIFRFETEDEAIALANDSEVGLAGYFYARDVGRIMRVAEALEVGIVGVNDGVVSTEVAPFGGFKESGLGREGSKYGLDDFLEIKYVSIGGLDR
ncbi:MAG: NAD-dependent succinate-semialdehyde dehydrogenase [Geminicoccaceae bacterium]|nr:MAG: NAD-dependent succinate-semialdehyde dehydrogenase [Geminicoccaceae bacterium]